MPDFQLFRLKVTRISGSLFSTDDSTSDLLTEAIASEPERSHRGFVWHIGNVTRIDDLSLYFALGRTKRTSYPVFDSKRRSFSEQEIESAPFTHVMLDTRLGLCAIAHDGQLANTPETVGNQLERMLNDTTTSFDKMVRFRVEPLKDPQEFIEQLRTALAVKSYTITFSRPNPFDANEDFQKPMEKFLQASDGETGKTAINGPDLDRTVLEELTRSAAATGNDASARVLRDGDSRPVTRRLKENASRVPIADEVMVNHIQVIAIVREAYRRIRYSPSSE